ncbi:MAG: site-2 protease family protein [Planctomycetota bacterium]
MPIRIHPTFFWLLMFLVLVTGWRTVAWFLVVFTFVVLHELSHCLVARAHGIPVLDVTLLPIGGVARLGAAPEHPGVEFRLAIAGPLFNFAVAALTYILLVSLGPVAPDLLILFLRAVLIVNLGLGLFNLLPAFPMDGGRVLRAYLATRIGYLDATHVAARVGRWIAAFMAIVALASLFNDRIPVNPFLLLLVAAFIYISGKQEEMAVAARHAERNLWRFFGFGEPGSPAGTEYTGRHSAEPAGPERRTDVIDVEGKVRTKDGGTAADAFRQLSEDVESHLKQ